MKNENLTLKKIYSDPAYEAAVKDDLEKAKNSLQKVADTWFDLDIGPITDIGTLVLNCEAEYTAAVNRNVEVPVQPGKYQISKDIWIKTLSIPVPNQLYVACRDARRHPYSGLPELWNIEESKVVFNQTETEALINAHTIYASGDKAKFIEELGSLVESLNSLNSRLIDLAGVELFNTTNPITRSFFSTWCSFEGGDGRGNNMQLRLSNEFLRNLTFIK